MASVLQLKVRQRLVTHLISILFISILAQKIKKLDKNSSKDVFRSALKVCNTHTRTDWQLPVRVHSQWCMLGVNPAACLPSVCTVCCQCRGAAIAALTCTVVDAFTSLLGHICLVFGPEYCLPKHTPARCYFLLVYVILLRVCPSIHRSAAPCCCRCI